MRIRIKNKMTFAEADQLIERYYEGLSTNSEEQQLRIFLSQNNLPERYRAEQAIFGYFGSKKQKKQFSIQPYIRWASVAMLVLTVGLLGQKYLIQHDTDYAYVDGKKITDIKTIKSQAIASLNTLSSEDEVKESLKNVSDNEVIEQQLGVFSELNN